MAHAAERLGDAENVPCRSRARSRMPSSRGDRPRQRWAASPFPSSSTTSSAKPPFRGQCQRRTARPGVAHDIRSCLARDAERGHVDERRHAGAVVGGLVQRDLDVGTFQIGQIAQAVRCPGWAWSRPAPPPRAARRSWRRSSRAPLAVRRTSAMASFGRRFGSRSTKRSAAAAWMLTADSE